MGDVDVDDDDGECVTCIREFPEETTATDGVTTLPCFFGLLVTEAIYVCTRTCLRIYAARRQVLCACYRNTMRYGWEFVKTFTPQILCPALCNPSAINVHIERKNRSNWEIHMVDWSAHVCNIEQARFPFRFFCFFPSFNLFPNRQGRHFSWPQKNERPIDSKR